ncbi:Cytochrome C biogenesis protein transmembrane region [Streptomyces lavendulae subsp. lavendulae]|uniref:Cytochrome C biogenesis protein transmembrane region n=1 Tax=Streptomyces lavendulae subsp. lavendulae TaxID=58340 RepID=A0A2K8P674_STRLA|nr:cytochrome c biogenesis protein CcdA [Streptomyces lavendulae]ATZ22247.1 Cytochrome C biogenesis protein transmembrane region [Streptomyces lavendulae subsp. lavendulae]
MTAYAYRQPAATSLAATATDAATAAVAATATGAASLIEGTVLVAAPVAFAAGLVSLLSPCVLPLVPGYLGYVTSPSVADLAYARGDRRGRMVTGTVLSVLGFTAVLVSGGGLFGYVGRSLLAHRGEDTLVLGLLTVLMGLAFTGLLPGFAQREFRSHLRPAPALAGAPPLGAVFAVGWTPCVGPTLAAVQAPARNGASAARGALLMAAYCLGPGLPFVLAALAFRPALGAFGLVKRHCAGVLRTGGRMLVTVGVPLATGVWSDLVHRMRLWSTSFTASL